MSEPPIRVYLDTNTFVHYLIKNKPPLGPKVESFFQDIESQKYLGVTTTFTISEYLGVVKEIVAEKENKSPNLEKIKKNRTSIERFYSSLGY
ncbi:MAG: hypothetical protein OEM77_04520 [Nitrosopumilus sp.]|nr:hypothetical protein [Nitrosopumilus sp.]MDH3736748.1 hypothetical protein [Nitrosopumilus sp.]MDH3823103.1 hypothetical protein [Nitrosopumilus sp.]MDH3834272.1 hypothetical protein [Nitrosopumilus sp.]